MKKKIGSMHKIQWVHVHVMEGRVRVHPPERLINLHGYYLLGF